MPLAFLRPARISWLARRPGRRHGLLLTVLIGFAANHAIWTHAHTLREARLLRELNSRIALDHGNQIATAEVRSDERKTR